MQIGPNSWHCITTDGPFVPHGGMYGDVLAWEAKAEKHGLKLCWNYQRLCFCAYTVYCGKPVFQMRFWNDRRNRPEMLTDQTLWLLTAMREQHGRYTGESFAQLCARAIKDEDDKAKREKEQFDEDAVPELLKEVAYAGGRDRPIRLIMPGTRGRLGRNAVLA